MQEPYRFVKVSIQGIRQSIIGFVDIGADSERSRSGFRADSNLSPEVLDYFKGLAEKTGLPYQKLIDLYLLDCAKKRKKLAMKWVA